MRKRFIVYKTVFFLFISFFSCSRKPFEVKTIGVEYAQLRNYSTAGHLTRIINRNTEELKIKLAVEVRDDLPVIVDALLNKELDFTILNSFSEYTIHQGHGKWGGITDRKKLRVVFSLHYETVTLICSELSGINRVDQIADRRINIGPARSQLQLNARDIISAYNLTLRDFDAMEYTVEESLKLFKQGEIDGFFITVSHPDPVVSQLLEGPLPIRLIPLDNERIGKLIENYQYYFYSKIPAESYANYISSGDLSTIGMKILVLTSDDINKKTVYKLTKRVFEDFNSFVSFDKAYSGITKKSMLNGFSYPLHDGVIEYLEEAGLIKYYQSEYDK